MEQEWDDDDYGDDASWVWGDPDAPDAIRHAMSLPDGTIPCCGKRYEQIAGAWMTADPERVNCPGKPAQP